MKCQILMDFIKIEFFHLCLYINCDNQRTFAINKNNYKLIKHFLISYFQTEFFEKDA